MNDICLHCLVSGRVQWVFFRRKTYELAVTKGITGWVKNLEDGRVEVLLCGKKAEVESLRKWLWEGPPAAHVTEVEVHEVALPSLTQFEVR